MIVAGQMTDNQAGSFAAKLCADYSVNVGGIVYGDWYLPSINELLLLYQQKVVVGGFTGVAYWSSTEYPTLNFDADYMDFSAGFTNVNTKSSPLYVRAIRSF